MNDVKNSLRFSSVSGLKIKLANMFDAPKFSVEVQKILPDFFSFVIGQMKTKIGLQLFKLKKK